MLTRMTTSSTARATVYGLVWAETLHIGFQLSTVGSIASLLSPMLPFFFGYLSGGLFGWLSRKYHWLLPAILLALLHVELAAWMGYHGPLALKLVPPTLLASILAPLAAARVGESKENSVGDLLCRLVPQIFFLVYLLGGSLGGYTTVHRTVLPDGSWAARVRRGVPFLGRRSDTVLVRPDRDWLGFFDIRLAEKPYQTVTALRWDGPKTLTVFTQNVTATQESRAGFTLYLLPCMAGDP